MQLVDINMMYLTNAVDTDGPTNIKYYTIGGTKIELDF